MAKRSPGPGSPVPGSPRIRYALRYSPCPRGLPLVTPERPAQAHQDWGQGSQPLAEDHLPVRRGGGLAGAVRRPTGAYPMPCRCPDVIVKTGAQVPGGHQSIIFAERQNRLSSRCHKKGRSKKGHFLISGENMGFGCDKIRVLGGGYEQILAYEKLAPSCHASLI